MHHVAIAGNKAHIPPFSMDDRNEIMK